MTKYNKEEMQNKFEGTEYNVLGPCNPWPPTVCSFMKGRELEPGYIAIWATGHATLVASLNNGNGKSFIVETCKLEDVDRYHFILSIGWSNTSIKIRINGVLVGSSNSNSEIPNAIKVKMKENIQLVDLSEISEVKRKKRTKTVQAFSNKPNQRLVSLSETMDDLENAGKSLRIMLDSLIPKNNHFCPSIASNLRSLICMFQNNRVSFPLLQRAAGLLDLPLIVFANPSQGTPPLAPEFWISLHIAIEPNGKTDVAMDLDHWLDLPGASIRGEEKPFYSNNDALRAIFDVRGSHYDVSISSFIDYLRETNLGIGGPHPSSTLLINLLFNVGEVTYILCERVVHHFRNSMS